jgi:hypothetical protein
MASPPVVVKSSMPRSSEKISQLENVKKLVDGVVKGGLAAAVLAIEQEVLAAGQITGVYGRTGEAAEMPDLDLGDFHALPSMMRTSSTVWR